MGVRGLADWEVLKLFLATIKEKKQLTKFGNINKAVRHPKKTKTKTSKNETEQNILTK